MVEQEQKVERYSTVAMFLHWLTVVLVIAAFILGPGDTEKQIYSSALATQRHLHETLGLTIFFLTLIRLAWRWIVCQPELPVLPPIMVFAARLVQYALYLILFFAPITAVLGAWLEGHPVDLIFGVNIGPWLSANHELGSKIAHVHVFLGESIMWVAGAHALAAIFHHAVRKDDILVSMLPRRVASWLGR